MINLFRQVREDYSLTLWGEICYAVRHPWKAFLIFFQHRVVRLRIYILKLKDIRSIGKDDKKIKSWLRKEMKNGKFDFDHSMFCQRISSTTSYEICQAFWRWRWVGSKLPQSWINVGDQTPNEFLSSLKIYDER